MFIFSFPEFKFPRPFRRNLHLNHRKAFILFFPSFILSYHPFVTGVLHGGSSWFNSFFKSLVGGVQVSFLLASRSAINSLYSFELEFCISSFFSDIQLHSIHPSKFFSFNFTFSSFRSFVSCLHQVSFHPL